MKMDIPTVKFYIYQSVQFVSLSEEDLKTGLF